MNMVKEIKYKWQDWLKTIAEANRKQFGSKVPDCCNLLNEDKHAENHGPEGQNKVDRK